MLRTPLLKACTLAALGALAACTFSLPPQQLKRSANRDALFVEDGVCTVRTQYVLTDHGPIPFPAKAALYVLSDLAGIDPTASYIDRLLEVLSDEMAKSGYVELKHRDFGMIQLVGHPQAMQVEVLLNRIGAGLTPEIVALDLSEYQ